jgi:hypothetical protein
LHESVRHYSDDFNVPLSAVYIFFSDVDEIELHGLKDVSETDAQVINRLKKRLKSEKLAEEKKRKEYEEFLRLKRKYECECGQEKMEELS